jgi:ssRNA-specific RNase YbeY (16S rRNA maturation enzyme)
LHLLGYDHENETEAKVMQELEKKILQAAKLER